MTKPHTFELGSKLRCRISGVTGIATGRLEFLNGCIQYGIRQRVNPDGKVPDTEWVDEAYLEETEEQPSLKVEAKPIGGEKPPANCKR